jgi:hypothetical protein
MGSRKLAKKANSGLVEVAPHDWKSGRGRSLNGASADGWPIKNRDPSPGHRLNFTPMPNRSSMPAFGFDHFLNPVVSMNINLKVR